MLEFYQLLFNSEFSNGQNTEHLGLTDILKINYVPLVSFDAEAIFSK